VAHRFLWAVLGGLLLLGGCASPYDPAVHPIRLATVRQTDAARAVDLNGDGRDELVRRGQTDRTAPGKYKSVLIQTLAGRAVAQVNFAGWTLSPKFADLTQDGRLELVVPVVQSDSLFYSIVGPGGEKRRRFFAVSGEPRREPGGTIAWDPQSPRLHVADVTGREEQELVSFMETAFARQPRGVWVHTYPEGRHVGHQRIGALVGGETYFGDVDDDGRPEWLFGSLATNNGATGGGMSDARAYLGAIEVSGTPQVEWARKLGGTFAGAQLHHGDLNGDGTPEFVALRTPREGRQAASPLLQIDPATGETVQRYMPGTVLQDVRVGALGPEGRDRVVVRDVEGTLSVLDEQFRAVHRRSLEAPVRDLQVLADANGDERAEVVAHTSRGTLWLGPGLSTVAATPQSGAWQVVQTGAGSAPQIAIGEGPNGKMTHVRAAENGWWWAYRYGPVAGLVLGGALLVGGGVAGWRRYRQVRLREAVHEQVAAHAERDWLLVHPSGTVSDWSAGVPQVLGLDRPPPVPVSAVQAAHRGLGTYLNALTRQPAEAEPEQVDLNGHSHTVTATPLEVTRRGRPYWLVWLAPEEPPDGERTRGWSLMAQRVAHDLKNPLTSILLTLQRMQMAYREQGDGLADELDPYAERIEKRIGSLRRMTTNVLKVTGKEHLRRTRTDLGAFVDEEADTLARNLPPDIDLARDLADDLSPVAADRDQLRSVLENLVANAQEAMPEGGRITLATRLARSLQLGDNPPRDYAVLEVLDTGTGMTPTERRRLFEPGFSTRDDTGLGMAIVRKIIHDHDGYIEVESEPEVGTAVTLYLPVAGESD